jgi:hypothetical protein
VHVLKPFAAPAAAALATAALCVASGGASTGPAQVRITDLQTSYAVVRSPSGGVVGSTQIVHQRLYNPRVSQRAIGHSLIVCTFADRRLRTCNGTYFLPKGQLVVAGAIESRLLYEIPIVGGTGLFDNARGSLTVTSTHLRPRREVLLFRLTG